MGARKMVVEGSGRETRGRRELSRIDGTYNAVGCQCSKDSGIEWCREDMGPIWIRKGPWVLWGDMARGGVRIEMGMGLTKRSVL